MAINASMDVGKGTLYATLYAVLVAMEGMNPPWKSVWRSLKKTETELCYGPDIPHLSIYPKDFVSYYKDTCTSMFIMTLFTITREQNQPGCPPTDK